MKHHQAFVHKFRGKKILVIGDVMLDKYIWGKVERISPEAPVPVVAVSKETFVPGGAANTAAIGTPAMKNTKLPCVVVNKRKSIAAPPATHKNCLSVKGPTNFVSVSMNCGS